jgi:4,5-DOPA dioxygenase extradiol
MPDPYDWAIRFGTIARELMIAGEYAPLIDYERFGQDAILSIPTPDHFLPLLYVLATRQTSEGLSFPVEGFDGGSISMLTAKVG